MVGISAEEALRRANEALVAGAAPGGTAFTLFAGAALGRPVPVRNPLKEFSYWTIPVNVGDHVIGFVRVLDTGVVAAIGSFCQDPAFLQQTPRVVTGMSSSEAKERAMAHIGPTPGEMLSEPVYVHDGPPGREAWLVEVLKDGHATRWVFVTPAFVYERRAGDLLQDIE